MRCSSLLCSRMCPQFDGLSQIPCGSSTFARKLSERNWYVSCRFRDETLHNIGNSARLERKSCWPDEAGRGRRLGKSYLTGFARHRTGTTL